MKVSLNIAQFYSEVDLKTIPKDVMIQHVGLQLGAVEEMTDYLPRYQQVLVVRVVSCDKHPNADKLHVCRIDDGGTFDGIDRDEEGLIQVVCGAPNVHADMFAAWIPPTATVPATWDEEPFILEAREIRGTLSNGMLASPKELAISEQHDGILEIEADAIGRDPVVGESLSNLFGLDDFVIDCENKMFTHRPDCFGNLGVARELAAINGLAFKSPEWYWKLPEFESIDDFEVRIKNEVPELVPRFMSVVMKNVIVAPSPLWMQAALRRVGIKPINNVVDVSNLVMHLTGQPTHAFDFDKLKKFSHEPSLYPRMSKPGEKLILLGQKEIELTGQEIVISTDKKAVALAGIMGGAETEVDDQTQNILIECATFDMYNIRKTSMRFGLFTDAVTRYSKGQSPLQNDRVLAFLMTQLTQYVGCTQASTVHDLRSFDSALFERQTLSGDIVLRAEFINSRLGTELSPTEMCELLQRTEFAAFVSEEDGTLHITAPFWRTDIELPEDIVEEVGRLYGYSKLSVTLPKRTSKPSKVNERVAFASDIRERLKESGANEVLTYSFVHKALLESAHIDASGWAYHLRNALSPDLQYYRPSLLPSLLAKVHPNIKSQAGSDENHFALFEIGKVHIKGEYEQSEPKLPKEMRRLAFVFAADVKTAKSYHGAPYYQAKKFLEYVTGEEVNYLPLDTNKYPITAPYQTGRAAIVMIGEHMLGVVGEFSSLVRSSLKLPEYSAGFELDLDVLMAQKETKKYRVLGDFPALSQDLTLEVDDTRSWHDVQALIKAELEFAEASHQYRTDIEPLTIFKADDSTKKRMSFRITVTHPSKTLRTEEVNTLLETIATNAEESLSAVRI